MLEQESLLTWTIIGAVAGWLAGLIVEGYGFGLLGNVVLGILGAVIAAFAAGVLGMHVETTLGITAAATIGAVALLLLAQLLRRYS